jgi:eukaryotic-like serine/threonine-protein kinase
MSVEAIPAGAESTVEWDPRTAGVFVRSNRLAREPIGVPASGMVGGRYRVSMLLGSGGMGAVWLAHDVVLRRAVALKRVDNEEREDGADTLREARAAARISHPGVVRVHDVLVGGDTDWIVMEALRGKALSTTILERGRLPVGEVAQIALQLLSALQAIHDADLVHRDVKPGNIQLCDGGRVVLTDFGLSSPRGVWGGLRVGAVAGSLPYLAPESMVDGQFGPPSDLYALGVTLYRAVEGRSPFDTSTPLASLESVLSVAPEPARHAGALGEVLEGLLEKDPVRRMDASAARSQLRAMEPATATSWSG